MALDNIMTFINATSGHFENLTFSGPSTPPRACLHYYDSPYPKTPKPRIYQG